MKKIFLFTWLSFSCWNIGFATERSFDEMISIAHQKLLQHATTPSNNTMLFTSQQPQSTDIELVASSDAYYIFNAENSFIIVSSDNRLPQILGYGFEGNYDTSNIPPALSFLLSQYDAQLTYLENKGESEIVTLGEYMSDTPEEIVPPLLTTKWGQGTPFNNLAPLDKGGRSLTGCVATAMAQIMNYFQYPQRGKGSHSYYWYSIDDSATYHGMLSVDFEKNVYDWNNMLDDYSYGYTDAQAEAVATLMYHCGVSVNMTYGRNASGSSLDNAVNAMKDYFDYDFNDRVIKMVFAYDNNVHKLYAELQQGRPIFTVGYHPDDGGHAFVLDGYDSRDYFHINWGWNGQANAYYLLSALNPTEENIGFNDDVYFWIGIQPNTEISVSQLTIDEKIHTGDIESSLTKLEIINCLGQLVVSYSTQIPSIATLNLPSGIHIFRYSYSDGTTVIKKKMLSKPNSTR